MEPATPTRLHRVILLFIAALAAGTFVFGILALRYGGQPSDRLAVAQTNSVVGTATNISR